MFSKDDFEKTSKNMRDCSIALADAAVMITTDRMIETIKAADNAFYPNEPDVPPPLAKCDKVVFPNGIVYNIYHKELPPRLSKFVVDINHAKYSQFTKLSEFFDEPLNRFLGSITVKDIINAFQMSQTDYDQSRMNEYQENGKNFINMFMNSTRDDFVDNHFINNEIGEFTLLEVILGAIDHSEKQTIKTLTEAERALMRGVKSKNHTNMTAPKRTRSKGNIQRNNSSKKN